MSEFVIEAQAFERHAEFEKYPATITGLESKEGKFGPQVQWEMLLDDDKGKGGGENGADRVTFTWTPLKITPGNKTGKLVAELTGKAIEPGQPYDLREFVGLRVNVIFEHYKKDDGTPGEKVFSIRPIA